jgi:hypothetical protein
MFAASVGSWDSAIETVAKVNRSRLVSLRCLSKAGGIQKTEWYKEY